MNATHSRAKVGGEFGANGAWYEGGKFINTVPENEKRQKAKRHKPCGKREVAPYTWEIQPYEGAIAIFPQLSGIEIFNRSSGKFSLNPDLREDFATPEGVSNRMAKIEAYNSGTRWT